MERDGEQLVQIEINGETFLLHLATEKFIQQKMIKEEEEERKNK